MTDNITLDQIRVDNQYNFASIYDNISLYEDDECFDSPFGYSDKECAYFEPDQFCAEMEHMNSKDISYFHLNCRGLSSNWELFRDLICDLHNEHFSFDFIGLSEIFKCDNDLRLGLPGYHNLITRCRDRGNRGGVGLFIRENLNYKIRDDLSVFIPHVYESLFIELISTSVNNNIIIGVLYRPNTQPKADMDIFSVNIYESMDRINSENKKGIIMGDVNVDLLKFGSHVKTNEYIENIFSRGFMPVITKPTRVTPSSATLIDHIYSNNISASSKSGIIINDVADHFGIFHIVKSKVSRSGNISTCKRNITKTNTNKFNHLLEQANFDYISQIDCPNHAFKEFINIYKKNFELAFPLTRSRSNNKFLKREPWVTAGFLSSSRTKTKLLRKKLKSPSECNIKNYKTYVKEFNKLKRILKISYYKDSLESNKFDMKKTWNILKQAIGKSNDKSNFPHSFKINDESVTNRTSISESFNTYFSKIGWSTSQNVPLSSKHYRKYLTNSVTNSMFLEPIESDTVIEVTNKLKPKSSSGHDNISTKLLKLTIHNIHQPLTHIINRSFSTGIVPEDLKVAKVIPIYKSSDKSELKNYRPVSLLSAFSKILEKIMFNKVMAFLDSNNILYKHQYGFRAKHATIHPILHLLNNCAESYNKNPKEYTISIFCDLSKAFDVINHNILLDKLNIYGLRGIVNDWFSNYLSGRTQYVEIEGSQSNSCDIECGVPQGSILGPLLYLLYVNDIANSTSSKILSFADDTSLFLSHSNITELFRKANTDMHALFEWFCANRLSLNPKKTKYILFRPLSSHCDTTGMNIHIGSSQLERIGSEFNEVSTKFLGLWIDEHLTWKHHIAHVNKKISRTLFAIKQVKYFLPINSLRTLYFALIHPHISYGLLAWGNANNSIVHKTEILQKRALRIINKSRYNSHSDPLFKKSQILKLKDMYEYQAALFMHDYRAKKLPFSFDNVFKQNCESTEHRLTRQSDLLNIARCDPTFSQHLPLYQFPRIWNKWLRNIPNSNSRTSFKNKLKSHLISIYSDEVRCNYLHCKDCR